MQSIKKLPILSKPEVLVVGGGLSGVVAALAAARNGAKVLINEHYGFLGGTATAGLVSTISRFTLEGKEVIGGISKEIIARLIEKSGVSDKGSTKICDPELLKLILIEMLEDAGVEILLHVMATDVILKGEKIEGVITESKGGRGAILARVVIDATGDADICAMAGAPFKKGREKDKLMQSVTLVFRIGNIKKEEVPDNEELNKIWKKSNLSVHVCENICFFWLPMAFETSEIMVNMTHILKVDGTNPKDLTRAEIEGIKQVYQILNYFRKNIPGFNNAYITAIAPQVGIRETRRIVGRYVLTKKDILEGKKFDDVVARGCSPIDIHNPVGVCISSDRNLYRPLAYAYDIPYRCLVPQKIKNLLICGRPISTTHIANSSTRRMATCMSVGQAAGTAAAIASKKGVDVSSINISLLQRLLKEQGAILD